MIRIYLKEIKSIEDTGEWGNDEIYAMVVAVDYSILIPSLEVTLYDQVELGKGDRFVYGEDKITLSGGLGNSQSNSIIPFWSIDRKFKKITKPDDVLFLIQVMENDDDRTTTKTSIVKVAALGAVGSSIPLDRESKIRAISDDIHSIAAQPTGGPNNDERIGRPKELRFSQKELKIAETIIGVRKKIRFKGDGGIFDLTFETQSKIAFEGSKKGFVIRQVSSGRLLDAHQRDNKDFSVVTRPEQKNDTQRWIIKENKGLFTIQQKSSDRFLDAHQASNNDFSAVTRPKQNNDTQKWIITPKDSNKYTIQQKSSNRFLDAHQTEDNDFSVVTRNNQDNDTQLWTILAE